MDALSFLCVLVLLVGLTSCSHTKDFAKLGCEDLLLENGYSKEAFQLIQKATGRYRGPVFNRAHIIPWSYIKNEKIFSSFPNFSFSQLKPGGGDRDTYTRVFQRWRDIVLELITDLHTIDKEAYYYEELYQKYWDQLKMNNNNNEMNCRDLVIQFSLDNIKDNLYLMNSFTNYFMTKMESLCSCMYNAPANIRPGYRITNTKLGEEGKTNIDPVLKEKNPALNDGKYEVKLPDITMQSRDFKLKYMLNCPKNKDTNNGIMTSDQPPP